MFSRISRVSALTGVALAAGLIAGPPAAGAGIPADLICTADFSFTFDPPLTLSGTVDAVGVAGLVGCLSPSGTEADLVQGVVPPFTATATGCPLVTITAPTDGGTIRWTTAGGGTAETRFDLRINLNAPAGPVSIEGTATGGRMAGGTIRAVPLVPGLTGDCVTGLRSLFVVASAVTITPF
jgi:hypothetical protein